MTTYWLYEGGLTLLVGIQLVRYILGRISEKTYWGICSLANAAGVVVEIAFHRNHTRICIDAAFTALFIWLWWKSGGGDDTKRRLRSLMKTFEPTRRTAPVHA